NGKSTKSPTISLLNARDSSRFRQTASDPAGHFSFARIAAGRYLVSASAVGHSPTYSPLFELSPERPSVTLKNMVLSDASQSLKEFAVVSKKPMIEQKADRMVI